MAVSLAGLVDFLPEVVYLLRSLAVDCSLMPVCSTVRRCIRLIPLENHPGTVQSGRGSPCHQVYAVRATSQHGNRFTHTVLPSLHGVKDEIYNEGTHLMVRILHRSVFHGHSVVPGTLVRDTNRF